MDQHDRPPVPTPSPSRSLILAWADSHGIDIGNEEADDLARRVQACAIPWDNAEVAETCITDVIYYLAGRVEHNPDAEEMLTNAACEVSASFYRAGLVERPRCVSPSKGRGRRGGSSALGATAPRPAATDETRNVGSRGTAAPSGRGPSWVACLAWGIAAAAGSLALTLSGMALGPRAIVAAPPLTALAAAFMCVAARARARQALQKDRIRKRTAAPTDTRDRHRDEHEPSDDVAGELPGSPDRARRDSIYCGEPVRVEVAGQGHGTVRHPPWEGRVRVAMPCARPTVVALDDLTPRSRRSLRRAKVRRRVEVWVRCAHPGCRQAFRAFATPEGRVEDANGEPVDALDQFGLLFSATCGAHKGRRKVE